MVFSVALLKSGQAGNKECAQHVLLSCLWQCPVLGSTEEVFLLQAGHSLVVCCSSLLFMAAQIGDELHRGSYGSYGCLSV